MKPGDVFSCKLNAHRQDWNGTICASPAAWECGTEPPTFRHDFCQRGDPRCFHMHTFDPSDPYVIIPDTRVVQFLQDQPKWLSQQILLFWGDWFDEPNGLRTRGNRPVLHGAYVVGRVDFDRRGNREVAIVRPRKDDWTLFPRNRVDKPYDQPFANLSYLRSVPDRVAQDLVKRAFDEAGQPALTKAWPQSHQVKLRRFHKNLPEWLENARLAMEAQPVRPDSPQVDGSLPATAAFVTSSAAPRSPFAGLQHVRVSGHHVAQAAKVEGKPVVQAPVPAPSLPNDKPDNGPGALEQVSVSAPAEVSSPVLLDAHPLTEGTTGENHRKITLVGAALPEPPAQLLRQFAATRPPEATRHGDIEREYGRNVLVALSVAFRSKGLAILSGNPGVGKSRLAALLLDDVARERSLIVPVSSTWRGREDLLGYVNPVSGQFEPTAFTRFLLAAEDAWDQGDQRARLVLFEEFNLSQPEHWFSDVLVRSEYSGEARGDRTIDLGGHAIAGHPGRKTRVFLPPCLAFVATVNNDHTVRALSPRVIDRAAVIEITTTVSAALARAGVSLDPALERVVDELNSVLETKGVAFSVRSALSLKRCEDQLAELGLTQVSLVDLVLAQEVLAKVRLMAGDPRDEQVLERLHTWAARDEGRGLTRCAARIDAWSEALRSGRDVFQA